VATALALDNLKFKRAVNAIQNAPKIATSKFKYKI